MYGSTKQRKKLEELFFSMICGISTQKDAELYDKISNMQTVHNKYVSKIRKYVTNNKEQIDNTNFVSKSFIAEIPKKNKNENLHSSLPIVTGCHCVNEIEHDDDDMWNENELLNKITNYNETISNNDIHKLRVSINNYLESEYNDGSNMRLIFHLFLMRKYQMNKKFDELDNIIINDLYDDERILNHIQNIVSKFNKQKFTLPQINVPIENDIEPDNVNFYLHLSDLLNEDKNKDNLQNKLKYLIIPNNTSDKSKDTLISMITILLNHLQSFPKKDNDFYKNIFELFLSKTLWYKNEQTKEPLKENERNMIIKWMFQVFEHENIRISKLDIIFKRKITSILQTLLYLKEYNVVTYCLASLIHDHFQSPNIITQYNNIVLNLEITANIVQRNELNKLIFSIFSFWFFTKHNESNKIINKVNKLKNEIVIQNKMNDNIYIHCALFYLNNNVKNILIDDNNNLQLSNIMKDIDNESQKQVKISSDFMKTNNIYEYLSNNNLDNILCKIKQTETLKRNHNNKPKITETFKYCKVSHEIVYVECPNILNETIINEIKVISTDFNYYDLNGLIIDNNDVLIFNKYTHKWYSMAESKWLNEFILQKEFDFLYLVYFRRNENEHLVLDPGNHFIYEGKIFLKTLKPNDSLFSNIYKEIKTLVPKLENYRMIYVNNKEFEFEIIEEIKNEEDMNEQEEMEKEKSMNKIESNKVSSRNDNKLTNKKSQAKDIENGQSKINNKQNDKQMNEKLESILKQSVPKKTVDNEIKIWINNIIENKNIKCNPILIFYIAVMICYKYEVNKEELIDFLTNEQIGITERKINNLSIIQSSFNLTNYTDFEHLENKIETITDKSNHIYIFLIRCLTLIFYINYNEEIHPDNFSSLIKNIIIYKQNIDLDLYNEYICKLREILDYNDKLNDDLFFKLDEIILSAEYEDSYQEDTKNKPKQSCVIKKNEIVGLEEKDFKPLLQIINGSKSNKDNVKQMLMSKENESISSRMAFYISIMYTYGNNILKDDTKNIITNIIKITFSKITLNKLQKLQQQISYPKKLDFLQLKERIKESNTQEERSYFFMFICVIFLTCIEKPIQNIKQIQIFRDLINYRLSYDLKTYEGYLEKLIKFSDERNKNQKFKDSLKMELLNVFLTHPNFRNIELYKVKCDLLYSIISEFQDNLKSTNNYIMNNLKYLDKILEILFYLNKQKDIANLLMNILYNLPLNKNSINLDEVYCNVKPILVKQFYENESMIHMLKYSIILFIFYNKSKKSGAFISRTRNISFQQTSNNIKYPLEIHLIYSYLNPTLRKHILLNKKETPLYNLFHSMNTSHKKLIDVYVNELKQTQNCNELNFLNITFNLPNVIQIIRSNSLNSFCKSENNEMPQLLYVEYEPKFFREHEILDNQFIKICENTQYELFGVITFIKENKFSKECFIYDKISQHWYVFNQKKWKGSLKIETNNSNLKGITLVYKYKKVNNNMKITIENLNCIKQKIISDKFSYKSTVDWFLENNKKIYIKYPQTFKAITSEYSKNIPYEPTDLIKNPCCSIF